MGYYIGRFDKTGCDCCSGTSFNESNGLTDIAYTIQSPAMAAQTRTYTAQLPMCNTYTGETCSGGYTYEDPSDN